MSKNFVESIVDVVNHVGWEAVDAEIAVWIEMGEFDYAVKDRMEALKEGRQYPDLSLNQQFHRMLHPSGPYGWEFCSDCSNRRSF